MKLRNRKTGEIVEFRYLQSDHVAPLVLTTRENDKPEMYSYNSLTEFNEDWEDYEEPKPWWYIDITLDVKQGELFLSKHVEQFKTVGNYFETREEAEKAVGKLKAWKRLKNKGFRFKLTPATGPLDTIQGKFQIEICADMPSKWFCHNDVIEDLDICFGGEE